METEEESRKKLQDVNENGKHTNINRVHATSCDRQEHQLSV